MRLWAAAGVVAVALLGMPGQALAVNPPVATCGGTGGTSSCTGWFRSDVTVSWTLDPGWQSVNCDGSSVTTDGAAITRACTVTYPGNPSTTFTASVTISRDATPPQASVTTQRPPDSNGWYNHPVGVSASGSDNLSGIASCTAVTYSGPDSASASVSGTCMDNAGNVSAPTSLALKYDGTAPSVSPSPARGADSNGWYNHPVDVAFTGTDATSGIASCSSSTYSGPDAGSATVSGTCRDNAGNSADASFGLKYDSTAPNVTGAAPARAPDANGWYNHSVVVTFAGSDATSGIASCDAARYDKPDDPSAKVTGRCRDNAGNLSDATSFSLKFDASPPTLSDLSATASDSAVTLKWKLSKDVANVTITRARGRAAATTTVYDGKATAALTDKHLKNGVQYSYVVKAVDAAGNAVTRQVTAAPSPPLFLPPDEARVHGSVMLRWRAVAHASYYNVQLWFAGTKILSRWPQETSFRVSRTWRYGGQAYSLRKGRYVWYVWPGFGPRTKHRFGSRIGASAFVVH